MSWIGQALGVRAARSDDEQRASSLPVSQETLAAMLAGGDGASTVTGRWLTPEGALSQVTLLSCVRLLSEQMSTLPWAAFRGSDQEGWSPATDSPVYTLLHDMPNPELTPAEMKMLTGVALCLWGNAYFEIEYDGAGRRRAAWPLPANRVEVIPPTNSYQGQREYIVTLPNGERRGLSRWQMWHIRGWGTDPWLGKSPVALMRESIARALAIEEYGGRFFGNDSRPGGLLKHPGKLTETSAKRLKDSWESAHRGLDNAHRVAVLEEGMEWQQTGVPPQDAQFIQAMQFTEEQMCQIYRVPPHMIGIVSKSTSWGTGIEQQSIGFVTYSLLPYLEFMSQAARRDLMTPAERKALKLRFRVAALLRGDTAAQNASFTAGRNGGWFSVNEIREMMEMNPVEGGDTYLQPLNMAPLGSEPDSPNGNTDASDSSQNGNAEDGQDEQTTGD